MVLSLALTLVAGADIGTAFDFDYWRMEAAEARIWAGEVKVVKLYSKGC